MNYAHFSNRMKRQSQTNELKRKKRRLEERAESKRDEKQRLVTASYDNPSEVKRLLDLGDDPNQTSDMGTTALMAASGQFGSLVSMKLLVEHGAVVCAIHPSGSTPLTVAIGAGRLDAVKYLVEMGADLDQPDGCRHILHRASAYGTGIDIVRFLVQKGTRIDQEDLKWGCGPMDRAAECNNLLIIQYLYDRGVKFTDRMFTAAEIKCCGRLAIPTATRNIPFPKYRYSVDATKILLSIRVHLPNDLADIVADYMNLIVSKEMRSLLLKSPHSV
jgi:ankyrin repeat protein